MNPKSEKPPLSNYTFLLKVHSINSSKCTRLLVGVKRALKRPIEHQGKSEKSSKAIM